MEEFAKVCSFLLIVLLALSSAVMVESASAQSIPKPSVPEFTIRFVDASYNVTTTNSYNGQTETQQISNNSVEVVIKNQPFSNATNSYNVYFNLRIKPHFENASWWQELYPLTNATSSPPDANGAHSFAWFISGGSPNQRASGEQTVVTFSLAKVAVGYDLGSGFGTQFHAFLFSIPENGQIDFQVEALVGHDSEKWTRVSYTPYWNPYHPENETFGFVPAIAYDSTSGWSNTQTINLADGSVTNSNSLDPTLSPTPNPQAPSSPQLFNVLIIVALASVVAIVVAVVSLLLYKRHRKK